MDWSPTYKFPVVVSTATPYGARKVAAVPMPFELPAALPLPPPATVVTLPVAMVKVLMRLVP